MTLSDIKGCKMARKLQDSKDNEVAKLKRIVQIPLLPDEVHEIESTVLRADDILRELEALVNAGWRFDILPNNRGDGISVLAKQSDPTRVNAGVGFYSNAGSLTLALGVTFVKLGAIGGSDIDDFLSNRGGGNSFS